MVGANDFSAAAFENEDAALGVVISHLEAGRRAEADATFYGPVHAFTHNVDPLVRPIHQDIARALCEGVIALEDDLAGGASNTELATGTADVRQALRDATVALGYPEPGTGQ
jgi:hypothetical protein